MAWVGSDLTDHLIDHLVLTPMYKEMKTGLDNTFQSYPCNLFFVILKGYTKEKKNTAVFL